MKYDFETVINRTGTGACKWEHMLADYPEVDEDIIPLSIADMELVNAPEIQNGLKAFIDKSVLGYNNPWPEYLDAVCGWMKRRHNWDVKKEWITQTPGVVPAMFFAVKAFTEPGDGVIIMTPVYYPFYGAVKANGRTLVENALLDDGENYTIDFDDLEKKAKDPANKLLLLCSPHNPVGRVWTVEELERIGRICIENDVVIVSDEIHFDLIMPGYEHHVFASLGEEFAQHCVVCTAPSKTFNLAGMQTSNIIIPNPELQKKFVAQVSSCGMELANILGYEACRIAYTECDEWLEELIALIVRNKEYVENFVKDHFPAVKCRKMEGTYLQWLDFRALNMDPKEQEKMMKTEAQLFLDDGYMFGDSSAGFERINLACPTWVIEKAMARLYDVMKKRFPELTK